MPLFRQCVQYRSFRLLSARKFDCLGVIGTYFNVSPTRNRSSPLDVLPKALRELYNNMSRTTESVVPLTFLTILRQVVPQFAEVDRSKSGMMASYAQQGLFPSISFDLAIITEMLSRCRRVLDTDLACIEGRPRY